MSVTSITLYYNSAPATNGLLLFTGNSYTLVAKDQSGNVLANNSGTWASTDSTNFPVNSSGVVSPAAGIGGGSVTFTHTASGVIGTVLVSVLKTPPAIVKQDSGASEGTTTGLMANIRNTVGVDSAYNSGLPVPTGTSGSLYTDGLGANHFSIDSTTASRQFMGSPVLVQVIPTTTPAADGALLTGVSGMTRGWALQLLRFDPGFTLLGTGGGAAAFKIGNWFVFSPGGRVGLELTNGNSSGGTGGHPGGNFVLGCVLQNGPTVVGGEPAQTFPNVTTEFYAGETWVSLLLYEVRSGNVMSSRAGWFKIGSVPNLTFGSLTVEGPMVGNPPAFSAPSPIEIQPTAVNYNQAPPSAQLAVTIPQWMMVNGDTYGDPFGVLNDSSSPTLTGVAGGTVTQGDLADTITLTGTNFTVNCWPKFSNTGIYTQSITITSSTSMSVVVAVDANAATGTGTVSVYNASSQATSGTQTVTVNASSSSITIRQHHGSASSPLSMTSTISGNTIIVMLAIHARVTASSVTDNVGNTYTQCSGAYLSEAAGLGAATDIWYCQNATGGCTSISVTTSNGTTPGIFGIEASGIRTSGAFEIAGHNYSSASSTSVTGGSVTTTNPADLIVGIGVDPGTYNSITGMATGNAFTLTDIVASAIGGATLITSSAGTYTPVWAQSPSGTQMGSTAAFKAAKVTVRQHRAVNGSVLSMSSTLSGSTIIVMLAMQAGVTASSVTDNAGNTYTQCTGAYLSEATGAGAATDIWYCQNATAGCSSITVTTSNGTTPGIFGTEAIGLRTAGVFDTAGNHYSATSSTSITGGSVTTTNATDLIVGIGVDPATYNTITGMASGNAFTLSDIVFSAVGGAMLITNTTGTYTPVWTQSSAGAQMGSTAAFKA